MTKENKGTCIRSLALEEDYIAPDFWYNDL